MVKAVIFDMDGLIIDSEPLWRMAEMEVFKSIGYDFTEEMCIQTMGMRVDEVVKYWHDQLHWKEPTVNHVINEIINKVIEKVKLHGTALPGVYQTIQLLKEKECPIALASSSSLKIINTVLQQLSLHDSFDVVHSAETEEFGKPHPAVFLTAAEKLNVEPKNCLVLEDSKAGMEAGLRAEMQVIVVPEINTQPDWIKNAHHYYRSLSDINWKTHLR